MGQNFGLVNRRARRMMRGGLWSTCAGALLLAIGAAPVAAAPEPPSLSPTTASAPTDLGVKQTATSMQDGLRLVVAVHNNGSSASTGVALREVLKVANPTGLRFVESNLPTTCNVIGAPTGWDVARRCATDTIAAGATWRVAFKATGTPGAAVQAAAQAMTGTSEPLSRNVGWAEGLVGPVADIAVENPFGSSVVTVRNDGPNDAVNVRVTASSDRTGYTFSLGEACTKEGTVTTCDIGSVGAGRKVSGYIIGTQDNGRLRVTISASEQSTSPAYDPDRTNDSLVANPDQSTGSASGWGQTMKDTDDIA